MFCTTKIHHFEKKICHVKKFVYFCTRFHGKDGGVAQLVRASDS